MRNAPRYSIGLLLAASVLIWPSFAGAQIPNQSPPPPPPPSPTSTQPQDPCAQQQGQQTQTTQTSQPAQTAAKATGTPSSATTNPACADDSAAKPAAKSGQPGSDAPVQQQQTVHPKNSKEDVEAIGNRSVGKGVNFYSLQNEIALGKGLAQEVERTSKMIDDPVVTEYVNRVGQNLVRNSDAQVPFTIKVIDSDEVNAFALPGGFFYVNSGLILAADGEAELAGVMAHEIVHVAARHGMRQMTRANWAQIGTLPLIFIGGGIGYAIRSGAGLALPMTFLSFSRGFESEADYLGLQYMYKSGYDPNAFVQFFEKLQAREKKKPGTLAKAFSTHPPTPDRIAHSQEEISRILPARPQYIITTSEF